MIPKTDMLLMRFGKFFAGGFVCAAMLLFAGMAHAHEVCWQNPTENVDGTPITDLQLVRVYWGTTSGGPYEGGSFEFATTGPGEDVCTDIPIPAGTWFLAATAVDTAGNESAFSNEVERTIADPNPNPPILVDPENLTAYTLVQSRNRVALLPVGTVAAGTTCDETQQILGRFVVPYASVTWAGTVRSEVVVASCSGP